MDLGQEKIKLEEVKTELKNAKDRSETLQGKFTPEMMDVTGVDLETVTGKLKTSEGKLEESKTSLDKIDDMLNTIEKSINDGLSVGGGE